MRRRILGFAIVLVLLTQVTFAQNVEVSAEKSTIKWLGKKIGGQHDGNIQLKSGSLELESGQIVGGSIIIDMTTITNTDLKDAGYSQKLVGHLNSDDFFGVEKYPTAIFKVTHSSKFSNGKANLTGDMTIKGKAESISFEVKKTGNEYVATIEIDRSKFDVRYGSNSFFDNLGDKTIDDIFTLEIKLAVND